jgi:hypothetical protein
LAHEVGHKVQDINGRYIADTAKNFSDREANASVFMLAVERGLGISGLYGSTGNFNGALGRVNSETEQRCQTAYGHGGTEPECFRF